MKVLLIMVLFMAFYSCGSDGDFKKEKCRLDSDCSTGKACYDGLCFKDYCKSADCGDGTCVTDSLNDHEDYNDTFGMDGTYAKDYYCECNSGSRLQEVGFSYKCVSLGTNTNQCYSNNDCSTNYECKYNKCEPKTNTQECTSDNDCRINYECKYNKCVQETNTNQCYSNNDCPTNYECKYNKCEPKTNTNSCSQDSECQSGYYCWVGSCKVKECSYDNDCPNGERCHEVFYICTSL